MYRLRKIKTKIPEFMKRYFPLWKWKTCQSCSNEFRWEFGWVYNGSRHGRDIKLDPNDKSYICGRCVRNSTQAVDMITKLIENKQKNYFDSLNNRQQAKYQSKQKLLDYDDTEKDDSDWETEYNYKIRQYQAVKKSKKNIQLVKPSVQISGDSTLSLLKTMPDSIDKTLLGHRKINQIRYDSNKSRFI